MITKNLGLFFASLAFEARMNPRTPAGKASRPSKVYPHSSTRQATSAARKAARKLASK